MKIISLNEIKQKINFDQALQDQKKGFVLYSNGQAIIPPVGHLGFINPIGDMHIKYGMLNGDDFYVIKIASGFNLNPSLFKVPVVQGMLLVFCAKSGRPLYLLQDDGYLTNLRTALAGRICAELLGPKKVHAIGVIGTGTQARLQVKILKDFYPCQKILVYGRNPKKIRDFIDELRDENYSVTPVKSVEELASHCNFIITTTFSSKPILLAEHIKAGTHITALGADGPGKNEIDPKIFSLADICAVDSKSQCIEHGDSKHAVEQSMIAPEALLELGEILANESLSRSNDDQITIADLSGVAVQDIQIAKSVIGS